VTKEVRDRLDQQLTEIQHLIDQINGISARLRRAADVAVETLNQRSETGDDLNA